MYVVIIVPQHVPRTATYFTGCGAPGSLRKNFFFLIGIVGSGVHQWPIVPAPGDYDDGEIGGMIGRRNRSIRRKPAPVPLCPPQTPHAARTRTRAAAVGSQRLTA
jgi:hypothetical protein